MHFTIAIIIATGHNLHCHYHIAKSNLIFTKNILYFSRFVLSQLFFLISIFSIRILSLFLSLSNFTCTVNKLIFHYHFAIIIIFPTLWINYVQDSNNNK